MAQTGGFRTRWLGCLVGRAQPPICCCAVLNGAVAVGQSSRGMGFPWCQLLCGGVCPSCSLSLLPDLWVGARLLQGEDTQVGVLAYPEPGP